MPALERSASLLRQVPRLLSSARTCTTKPASRVPYKQTLQEQQQQQKTVSVPAEADVVVIGGGSMGCNTLYYLTKLGMTNTVLLEKDQLTAGTTWHTAGLMWRLRPGDIDTMLLMRSHQQLNSLEEETGVYPGWIENGGLFIASTKERMFEYQRLATMGQVFGIECYMLGPQETQKLYPLMNVKDIYATLHSPRDGTINPAEYCTALTRAATSAGAKVIEKCLVNDILTSVNDFGTRHVSGVVTPFGTIKTNCVVNCTGVWAPYLGKLAGVHVPLTAMKHAYVVTEKIPGIENMPNVRDHDHPVYLRLQGDALCVGGYESNPIFLDDVPKDFAFSLYELDWDVFSTHLTNAMNRIPCLEKTGIKSTVCGPESFTPDHKPILGEDPNCRGFYHGCAMNSGGLMFGAGCGEQLAMWVVNGRPELDMFAYDIRRYCPTTCRDPQWLKERSHEAYAKHYYIVWPHDEHLSGRNIKVDAFHKLLEDRGCVYQERMGMERPGWFSKTGTVPVKPYDWYGAYENIQEHESYPYSDTLALDYSWDFSPVHKAVQKDCLNCRERAAIFNMSYFGKFYLTGPDAQAAADWIFSNRVDGTEGTTVYTCMLNRMGGIEVDLTTSILESGEGTACDPKFEGRGFYIAAGGGAWYQSWAHIQSVIQDKKFDVTLTDLSQDMGLLSIQGPRSREILQSLTSADFSDDAFPFSTHKIVGISGHKCRALRLSFVGELGWELHIPSSSCEAVYLAVEEAGRKHGLINAGYRAIDSLSIEKGYRHWHADIRTDDTPLEGAMAFTCKLKTDTPFLGREALQQQKKEGMKKRLVCFTLDEKVPLWGQEAIYRSDQLVGFLRRCDYAYALDKSIGYGYVSCPDKSKVTMDYLKSGEYWIESMGKKYKAQMHTKTPFDPQNKRVKGIYDEPLPVRVA